jgi:hypothetical protein
MRITLCSSAQFFSRLRTIQKILESRNHQIHMPSMKDFQVEDSVAKVQNDLIGAHFRKIVDSDAIYVANYEKSYLCCKL